MSTLSAVLLGNLISFSVFSVVLMIICFISVYVKKKRIKRECADVLNDIFGRR